METLIIHLQPDENELVYKHTIISSFLYNIQQKLMKKYWTMDEKDY